MYHNFLDFFLNCQIALANKAKSVKISSWKEKKSFGGGFPNSASHTALVLDWSQKFTTPLTSVCIAF